MSHKTPAREQLARIRLLVLDFDGVLTDNRKINRGFSTLSILDPEKLIRPRIFIPIPRGMH